MGGARIRSAEVADAPEMAALIRTAFSGNHVVPPPSALGETAETIGRTLSRPDHWGGGAVAEVDGRIVGAVLWDVRGSGLYLNRLAVAEAWRRQGIGRMLIEAGERTARKMGIGRLELGTRLFLTDNRRLFASCGFRETTRHRHVGFDEDTWVSMERILG